MNIYEKILAIMQEVRKLQKDDNVKFGTTNYKALSEEKVTEIMREKMIKYKLVVFPFEQESSRTGNISHVDVKYRMVNTENPEESIVIASCGDGADTQDKGSGKAMTYAFKYMWLRTFALPTGEDPDQISSEELDAEEKAEQLRKQPIGPERAKTLEKHLSKNGIRVDFIYKKYKKNALADLTEEEHQNIIQFTKKIKEAQDTEYGTQSKSA